MSARAAAMNVDAQAALTLAGIALAAEDEAKHFKFIGTTGTGKSTAIHEVLSGALARGDRAVIADPEGGYLRRFYDAGRGDVILNPFDARAVKWDLFGEIKNAYDVEQLARALIPDDGSPDRAWRGYARTFFSAVTRQAHGAGCNGCRRALPPDGSGHNRRAAHARGRHARTAIPRGTQRSHVRFDPFGGEFRSCRARIYRRAGRPWRAVLGAGLDSPRQLRC